MNTRLQNLAAAHGALWSGDPWYRWSWFIWPLAMASLAAGWLTFHGAPAGADSHAPWAVPAQEALSPNDADRLRDSAKTDAAAFERLKALAANGDKIAQFSLGTLYDPSHNFSKLTKSDVNQAIAWYTKAAEQGFAPAQASLGIFFHQGKWVTQNFVTAVFWLEKAATQGNAVGERVLAISYQAGNGVAADPVHARELFQSAANKGDAYSQGMVGLAYEGGYGGLRKDRSEAIKWYLKAANQGNEDAKAALKRLSPGAVPAQQALSTDEADMLRDSAKTDVAAFERLKTLAASGDKNAQFSLGTLYDPYLNFSKLTNPDVNQAIAWYTKAAEQGQGVAQFNLGGFFLDGKFGVTPNFATAFFWYQKSAAQGYAAGERGLAICYANGHGVAADQIRATELFQSAANKGDAYSEAEIGSRYEKGSGGLRADRREAIKWYLKAADHGDEYAKAALKKLSH